MGNCLKVFALILGLTLAAGCASQKNGAPEVEKSAAQRYLETREAVADANQAATGHKLVKRAHTQIGTPYVLGGSKPGGFDCSGLVKWAYKEVGVQLPRTAREQSVVGTKIHRVEDMRAGDIVAFRHPRNGYHTGIYVGDGKFIHSPRKRTTVRINSLDDPYFKSTLLGARRVAMDGSENLIAQAEERLGKMAPPVNAHRAVRGAGHSRGAKKLIAVAAKKNGKKVQAVAANTKKSAPAAKKGALQKNAKKVLAVAANTKKNAAAAQKNAKKTQAVALAHSKSARLGAKRAMAHSTAPVKAPAKQVAAKKNGHKAISMLQQSKGKRAGKDSRS